MVLRVPDAAAAFESAARNVVVSRVVVHMVEFSSRQNIKLLISQVALMLMFLLRIHRRLEVDCKE